MKTTGSDGRRREKYSALQSRLKQRRIVNDSGSKEARLYHQSKFNLLRKKRAICLSSSRPASHACHHIKLWIAAVKNA